MTRHAPLGPAIPDDSAPVPPAHRPTRWTVRTVRGIGMVFLGLAVALSLLSTLVAYRTTQDAARQARDSQQQAAAVERRLSALEDYVAGKGAQRDAETQRQNEQFDRFVCGVLDQLPAGPSLDGLRTQYGCGPGQANAADGTAVTEAPSTAATVTAAPQSTPAAAPTGTAVSASTPASAAPPTTAPTPAAPTSPGPQPAGLGSVLCTALPIIC